MRLKERLSGVITGASTGIGKALAIMLASRYKARLVLAARSAERLEETAEAVRAAGGEAVTVAGDVGDRQLAASLPGVCLAEFADLDILVNNAGLAVPGPLPKLSPEDWRAVFAVNFFAPLESIYSALPHFLARKEGKIVNIASVAGKVAFPGSVCYSASKFALTGMSEGMGAELASRGIDVITVCPGWVRSEFFSKNRVSDDKNPTLIARGRDLKGFIMRNCLSISSDQCARDIIEAMNRSGPQEIVLTGPGVFIERFAALMPSVCRALVARIPPER